MVDFGINSDSIHFEVALDLLGDGTRPFRCAIEEEEAKEKPSAAFIKYCKKRIEALNELQDELMPSDMDTVKRICYRRETDLPML